MLTMANTLTCFEKPDLTPEQWAEKNREAAEWEEQRRAEAIDARINRSGIPREYRGLSMTDADIEKWVANPTYGLIIRGKQGRMKTGNACAALCELASRMTILFTTVDDMVNDVRATFSSNETASGVIGRYGSVGCLCIDDFGGSQMSQWVLSILFDVIKKRDEGGKLTILTTNYESAGLLDWMTVDGDDTKSRTIASRLSRCTRVTLGGPDRRWA